MKVELLIKNCNIVNADSTYFGDIGIIDGKIALITKDISDVDYEKVIDAENKYVIPGGVDGHTHMMDPGYTEREDFTTGTMAAAKGGITTIINHHRTLPNIYSADLLKEKIKYLEGKAIVDYGLKGGISPDNIDELEKMWNMGITGLKTFTCNLHGVRAMYSGYLLESFQRVSDFDGTVLIHSEDDSIIETMEKKLHAENRTDYLSQYEWRNPLAEEIAINTVISIAKKTKARVIIAHVSQAHLLERIKRAREEEGVNIYAETCPHYMHLTIDDLQKKGPWVKFTPPMKTKENREKMWELFDKGYVTNVGSDHCPYIKEDKEKGLENIWLAPNGIPGIETGMRIFLDGVNKNKTSLNRVVETMSTNPAKIYGLYPKKGVIGVGSDADIVILDMETEEIIKNEDMISKCGWSPYDGDKFKGKPETVLVRGKIVFDRDKILAEPGHGKFQKRMKTIEPKC